MILSRYSGILTRTKGPEKLILSLIDLYMGININLNAIVSTDFSYRNQ